MYTYEFTPRALKRIGKLHKDIQNRIITKLDYYVTTPNPLVFAEYLTNSDLGQYRFRIGDYRVIFDVEDDTLIILSVGHRREIYK